MAFRNASTIKIISDAINPADTTLDGAVGTKIDLAIAVAAAITTVKTEKITVDLNAVINGRTTPVEIVQAGGNLQLNDVLIAIEKNNFRVVARPKKAGREGGQDRVTLTIAWNTV